jgi:hypothetical protein
MDHLIWRGKGVPAAVARQHEDRLMLFTGEGDSPHIIVFERLFIPQAQGISREPPVAAGHPSTVLVKRRSDIHGPRRYTLVSDRLLSFTADGDVTEFCSPLANDGTPLPVARDHTGTVYNLAAGLVIRGLAPGACPHDVAVLHTPGVKFSRLQSAL